jgi:hypothetical protein
MKYASDNTGMADMMFVQRIVTPFENRLNEKQDTTEALACLAKVASSVTETSRLQDMQHGECT